MKVVELEEEMAVAVEHHMGVECLQQDKVEGQ